MQVLKNVAAALVLHLVSLSVTATGFIQTNHIALKSRAVYKNEPEPRMFLITVIDSDDDTIGKRCERDMEEIIYAFRDLSDWLGVDFVEPKVINGDGFSKAAVNDVLDNWLRVQNLTHADIVVFYYSGHGFRLPGDTGDYPRMWLKTATDKDIGTTNLRIEEDVYDRIVKMGAGLNIVLSDCCNTNAAGDNAEFDNANVPVRKRVPHKRDKPREEGSPGEIDNGDKLFIQAQPLSILATAAAKGEFAGGKSETGGFFTNYLLEALDECIYETNLQPTWQSIFSYVNKNAGYWARSAACPNAKHNAQGRCLQTLTFKVGMAD